MYVPGRVVLSVRVELTTVVMGDSHAYTVMMITMFKQSGMLTSRVGRILASPCRHLFCNRSLGSPGTQVKLF